MISGRRVFFSPLPLPPSFFRPRTYHKGYILFLLSLIFHCHKIKDENYNNITNTNKVSPIQNTPALQAKLIVSLYHFQKYWNFDLECKHGQPVKQLSGPENLSGLSRKGPPYYPGNKQVILCPSHDALPSWFRVAVSGGSSKESGLHYPKYIYLTQDCFETKI